MKMPEGDGPPTGWFGAARFAAKALTRLFKPGDIPICHTRVMRGNRGMPWDGLIAIHPGDDRIEIRSLQTADRHDPGPGNVLGLH